MNDPTPINDNRLAVLVGRLLDPLLLPIPTLLLILVGLPIDEAVGWFTLVTGMLLIPGIISKFLMERYIDAIYKRRPRGPLYLIACISTFLCLAVLLYLHAPLRLIASVASLAIWAPLQWAINAWVTKVSAHAAVAAGCFTALVILGKAGTPLTEAVLFALVALTLWARVVTRNHTVGQVILGALVGTLPVLLVFPLVLT